MVVSLDSFSGLFNTIVSDLNNINADAIWSGIASDNLIDNLDNNIEALTLSIGKLKRYSEVLEMMSKYAEIDLQINALQAQLNLYSGNDEEFSNIRAMIMAQINKLLVKKGALKNKIVYALKHINDPIILPDSQPNVPSFDDSENANDTEPDVDINDDAGLDTETNLETDVGESNPKIKATYDEVPLFYQSDYTDVKYGTGTLKTHGCGISSLSMVASYYNDEAIMPDELAKKYHTYGSKSGTNHMIYEQTAEELNLPFQERVHYSTEKDLQKVVSSLEEGCVIVAKAKGNSVFTNSGHYIVLTGVTEDGKIKVNDPNKFNYKEYNEWCGTVLEDGFANGFDQEQFKYGKIQDFFIYSPKS